ncbi:Thymidine kinase [Streptomyces violaceorubidus]
MDYVIADEAQFLAPDQIDQLARVVDDLEVDVYAFGITTDFRSKLFPGSQRLVELADRVEVLQVEALCWCGARATHNARTVGGVMVVEGAQVVVGDVAHSPDEIGYEVLCRRHHRRRMTSATSGRRRCRRTSCRSPPTDLGGTTLGWSVAPARPAHRSPRKREPRPLRIRHRRRPAVGRVVGRGEDVPAQIDEACHGLVRVGHFEVRHPARPPLARQGVADAGCRRRGGRRGTG